jgi:YidC/Oxa1 family membrane protein insertase
MDRNSAIGLTLIALLLIGYFYFFSPTPQPSAQEPVSPVIGNREEQIEQPEEITDSATVASFGGLSAALTGRASEINVQTEDLNLKFSTRGGVISNLELKKYKTYSQQPLELITPTNNLFKLATNYQGKPLDLYQLYYEASQRTVEDTTLVSFTINFDNGAKIVQQYKVPATGYQIGYTIQTTGLRQHLSGEHLVFHWENILKPIEKDLTDTRQQSTISYYTEDSGFDELSQRSTDREQEELDSPVKWVTIKEKFFLSAIVAESHFGGGNVETNINESDSSVVKRANIELLLPTEEISDATATFDFYFGPNDYKKIGSVAPDFAKNVYLGWPPVYWVNKFVIFPVFYFLTQYITNFGLIIVILVILLKLVLFPLSYKSYLSMAKMKVLKPQLDEIKERVGDDMTKVQQEQMKLYSQVGVNPISGCIPVLLQMPILFAMFYLFPASIELRQEHFLWAEDLSTYDSLITLPFTVPFLGSHLSVFTLLMTISTLIYTWQNNQLSSVQGPMKSMSYAMPVIFLFVLNRFSAGLTFYYFVSNLVTFAQQAIIRRFVDEDKIKAIMEENKKKNAAGGGKKSKFMSKLEEAMKASEVARRKSGDERRKRKDK